MTPVIKLIHDDERHQWLCGDEDGNIVIVIDEMFDEAAIDIESKLLKKVRTSSSEIESVEIPVVPASFKAVYTGEMTVWEVNDLVDNPPDFGSLVVELQTGIAGDYRFRAGFSKRAMIWVYYNGFKRIPERVR